MGVARVSLYLDRGDMVTTVDENRQLVGILLKYISRKTVGKIIADMEIEVGDITENLSLRDSIKMAKEYLE